MSEVEDNVERNDSDKKRQNSIFKKIRRRTSHLRFTFKNKK